MNHCVVKMNKKKLKNLKNQTHPMMMLSTQKLENL